jgi:hypothetical protein
VGQSACWAGTGGKGPLANWNRKLLVPVDMNSEIEIKVWKLI